MHATCVRSLQTEEHAKAVCSPVNHYTPLTEEEVQVRHARLHAALPSPLILISLLLLSSSGGIAGRLQGLL